MGDGGQAAISLTPDVDGTGSSSLLDSILSALLKKRSRDVWVVLYRASYITAAFTLASRHSGLEVKILYYCTLYSTVKYTEAQALVEDART